MAGQRRRPNGASSGSSAASAARVGDPIEVNLKLDVINVRRGLGLTRKLFSRLSGYGERTIAGWESGDTSLSDSSRQRMKELHRLQIALERVMKPKFIAVWLQTPNDGFSGLKPLEVIERGEVDRIWQMIFAIESGMPG